MLKGLTSFTVFKCLDDVYEIWHTANFLKQNIYNVWKSQSPLIIKIERINVLSYFVILLENISKKFPEKRKCVEFEQSISIINKFNKSYEFYTIFNRSTISLKN